MSNLEEYRNAIDEIDEQIITLIGRRKQAVEGVMRCKAASNLSAYQPSRFEEVLALCRQHAIDNQLDPAVIETIWRELHRYFLRLEENALNN